MVGEQTYVARRVELLGLSTNVVACGRVRRRPVILSRSSCFVNGAVQHGDGVAIGHAHHAAGEVGSYGDTCGWPSMA